MLYREFHKKISRRNFAVPYCCKDYKNVTGYKTLFQSRFFVWFSGFESSLLKYKKFYKLKARKFDFQKYKTSFWKGFFYFSDSESSVSGNIRKFRFLKYKGYFSGFFFGIFLRCMKYKKNFLLRKYKKFLHDRARKFHLQYKNFLHFYIFQVRKVTSWNLKSFSGFSFLKYKKVPSPEI